VITTQDTTNYKASSKRYTLCPQCSHEVHSPHHDMFHRIWQKQQLVKQERQESNEDTKQSIVIEAIYQGIKYKGVLYPDKDNEVIQ
jgi:hypothetical protein